MPPEALAMYTRWWQIESWLRQLAHVELRARFGTNWIQVVDDRAKKRHQADQKYTYMPSPDSSDVLAYLDLGVLRTLLNEHWELFEPSLLDRGIWGGRLEELQNVRNRIEHIRRPHDDDLGRLEQMLRDLEAGARSALGTYHDLHWFDDIDMSDPVVRTWELGMHENAHLIEHARRQYGTDFQLNYTLRPWAKQIEPGVRVTGHAGALWHVTINQRDRYLQVEELWRDYIERAPDSDLLIHLLIPNECRIQGTFSAVDDATLVCDSIRRLLEAVLVTSTPRLSERARSDLLYDPLDDVPAIDPRVQIKTPWADFPERSRSQQSVFGANPPENVDSSGQPKTPLRLVDRLRAVGDDSANANCAARPNRHDLIRQRQVVTSACHDR
jgi:hypothetical protein